MVAKRKRASFDDLDVYFYDHHNPSLMAYFACNKHGTAVYIHGTKRPKKRGVGYTVDKKKVNSRECVKAWKEKLAAFMNATGSKYVICDGVKIQHTKLVKDYLFINHGIAVHPSACKPHNIKDGYPPYSHCFMPLDHRVFASYQQDISTKTKALAYTSKGPNLAKLYDIIIPTFCNQKMRDLARKTIESYSTVCQEVIKRKGSIKRDEIVVIFVLLFSLCILC